MPVDRPVGPARRGALRLRYVDVYEDELVLRLDAADRPLAAASVARAALRALGRAALSSLEHAGWRLARIHSNSAGHVCVVARRT